MITKRKLVEAWKRGYRLSLRETVLALTMLAIAVAMLLL